MHRLSFARRRQQLSGALTAGEHDLQRGADTPELRARAAACRSRRAAEEPAARQSAGRGGRRFALAWRRQTLALAERSGVEDPRRLGTRELIARKLIARSGGDGFSGAGYALPSLAPSPRRGSGSRRLWAQVVRRFAIARSPARWSCRSRTCRCPSGAIVCRQCRHAGECGEAERADSDQRVSSCGRPPATTSRIDSAPSACAVPTSTATWIS